MTDRIITDISDFMATPHRKRSEIVPNVIE